MSGAEGGAMSHPYAFLEGKTEKFFDEGAEFPGETVDLMGFSYDEATSFGMVERIVEGARSTLAGLPTEFVRAVLWVGDWVLDTALDDLVLSSKGERVERENLDFKSLNQLDFIGLVLLTLGRSTIMIGDEKQGLEEREVTPARFFAAYALRMIYNGTREYLRDSELREYYLMQAATAYGFMQAVIPADEASVSDAISASVRRDNAKKSAAARYATDPKAKAMSSIRDEWERWQRREVTYRSDADFGRKMHLKHPALVSDRSIAQRAAGWRKEAADTLS